jgi:hypothetical protein
MSHNLAVSRSVHDRFTAWHEQYRAGNYTAMPHGPPRLTALDGGAELGWDQRSWQAIATHADSLGGSRTPSGSALHGGSRALSTDDGSASADGGTSLDGAVALGDSTKGSQALESATPQPGPCHASVTPSVPVLAAASSPVPCAAGGAALGGALALDGCGAAATDCVLNATDSPASCSAAALSSAAALGGSADSDVGSVPHSCHTPAATFDGLANGSVLDVTAAPVACLVLCGATTLGGGGAADGVVALGSSADAATPGGAAAHDGDGGALHVATCGAAAVDSSADGSVVPATSGTADGEVFSTARRLRAARLTAAR